MKAGTHRRPKHRADVAPDSCRHVAIYAAGRSWCHGCYVCDLCGVGKHRARAA